MHGLRWKTMTNYIKLPQSVATELEWAKQHDYSIMQYVRGIDNDYKFELTENWLSECNLKHIRTSNAGEELLMKAWLNGYEIEEEKQVTRCPYCLDNKIIYAKYSRGSQLVVSGYHKELLVAVNENEWAQFKVKYCPMCARKLNDD